jgi:hypothetical protein
MFPLVPSTISSVNRGEPAGGAARAYTATRGSVETPPVEAGEASSHTRGRRSGERRQRRPLDDPYTGQNLDIEV